MKYKPNWLEAQERLTAFWNGKRLDRPCIAVTAPNRQNLPTSSPATPEQRWTDPDWFVPNALAEIGNTWWGGEAMPSIIIMAGWLVCFGGDVRYADDTIWHEPVAYDFSRSPDFTFDPDQPFIRRHTRLYCAMTEAAGWDDFLLGSPLLLPASDLLSMQMGAEAFLTHLVDYPDWMHAAIVAGARAQIAARKYYRDLVVSRHKFWYGNGGWMPFWAPEPFHSTQSDVSCMMAPAMFDKFVLPELQLYSRELGPLWYHLDGADARQHLPSLFGLKSLRVLQYTPRPDEPPNGPAHLGFYRQVQAAGKIIHIAVSSKEDVLSLARALDPALLMMETNCASEAEGNDLLAQAARG